MRALAHELLNEAAKIAGVLGKMEQKEEELKDGLVQIEVGIKRMRKALRTCQLKIEDIKNEIQEG